MTQQAKDQAPRRGIYVYWLILVVTAVPALYIVLSNALFRNQPILDTIATTLALAVLSPFALDAFWRQTYRVMSLGKALKFWGYRVGKAFPFMLGVYGALSWSTGGEPLWWYITATVVGALGTLALCFWWYLKEIAPRTV